MINHKSLWPNKDNIIYILTLDVKLTIMWIPVCFLNIIHCRFFCYSVLFGSSFISMQVYTLHIPLEKLEFILIAQTKEKVPFLKSWYKRIILIGKRPKEQIWLVRVYVKAQISGIDCIEVNGWW